MHNNETNFVYYASHLVLQHQQVKDSYRYSLVNSLIAQQTCLHSSALG